jgi:hypothetical protein
VNHHRAKEAFMNVRKLILAVVFGSVAVTAAAPAFADDDWYRHERHEWHERAWREHDRHEWRERAWREHEWREHAYGPPVVVAPGYYAPPPVYYETPSYYR